MHAAVNLLERLLPAANAAIQMLVDARVLAETRGVSRDRTFEAREIVDAFTVLEEQLASPAADARVEKPVRPVPSRLVDSASSVLLEPA